MKKFLFCGVTDSGKSTVSGLVFAELVKKRVQVDLTGDLGRSIRVCTEGIVFTRAKRILAGKLLIVTLWTIARELSVNTEIKKEKDAIFVESGALFFYAVMCLMDKKMSKMIESLMVSVLKMYDMVILSRKDSPLDEEKEIEKVVVGLCKKSKVRLVYSYKKNFDVRNITKEVLKCL